MALGSNACRKTDVQKGFHYEHYLRGRKTARKTKPTQGIITLKKKKSKQSVYNQISSNSNYSCLKKEARGAQLRNKSVGEYQTLDVIGQGSYGVVYRARDNKTGEIVAVKEELHGLSPISLTEIEILKSLNPHPSIITFKKAVTDGRGGVYVVMEHVENDLRRYMASRRNNFTMKEVRFLMKQLIEGVKFLHENHVMHRDLKPGNLLINSRRELKICDFGLSCRFRTSGEYSTRVGTQWYRAPELLLGDRYYSCAIDMWSVGCIMGELVLGEALFRGQSDVDQLDKIFGVVGSNGELFEKRDNVIRSKLSFSGVGLMLNEVGFDLLERLLTCDPGERITPESALNHAWFKE